jgi:serine/threonine-protein kinase RsbT
MAVRVQEMITIASEEDIVQVRAGVKRAVTSLGFSLVNQTKVVTAASELARNTLDYGMGGVLKMEILEDGARTGLRLRFEDQGPGIPNIDQALKDGFTSGKGMGLGLGGSKRLMDDFDISSAVGKGTVVSVTKWK